jgi:hypothetical protein
MDPLHRAYFNAEALGRISPYRFSSQWLAYAWRRPNRVEKGQRPVPRAALVAGLLLKPSSSEAPMLAKRIIQQPESSDVRVPQSIDSQSCASRS